MQITSIEKDAGSGMWHGTATRAGKNCLWYYRPRSWLRVQEQDEINPRSWMNFDPQNSDWQSVLNAVRVAKRLKRP
jgi:hypothetical protein